jgi:hypothetical protein
MILISLKDGKEIKLNSKKLENSNDTMSNKVYNLRPVSSSIIQTKKEATLNQINLYEDSNSSTLFSDTESSFDIMDHSSEISSTSSFQQSVGETQEQKKKRQRLTHLTAEEKLMRRKLKNRVAAQSARDRKKVKMEDLEQSVSLLRSQNEQLRNENETLKEKTRKLLEENQRLKSLNQTIKPMIESNKTVLQVVDVAKTNTCLKRKLSELKDCVEVDESAAFISTVSLQKKQLQMPMFQQLVYVLIMYTMNLIRLNNNSNSKTQSSMNKQEIGYKSTMSFCYQQQKRQQMNVKLKKTLLKLINLLKHHRPANHRQILMESSSSPPTHQVTKFIKQLNLQQTNLSHNSKSFKLIILMSLITSLMKRKI